MIQTEAGLKATREALGHLENALFGLTQKKAAYHPATFALLAAPIRDEILARRAEIDEYIGLTSVQPGPASGDGNSNLNAASVLTGPAELSRA